MPFSRHIPCIYYKKAPMQEHVRSCMGVCVALCGFWCVCELQNLNRMLYARNRLFFANNRGQLNAAAGRKLLARYSHAQRP